MMPGVSFDEIWKALASGFSKSTLRQMLRVRLNVELDNIVADGSLNDMTFELLQFAERENWATDLVREAYQANSRNVGLMKVYQKFGLATDVRVQSNGIDKLAHSIPMTDSGFEVACKQNLPLLDVLQLREQLLVHEGKVCRIELNDGTPAMGTGFLVGADLVLTNFHVMERVKSNTTLARGVRLRFDYKKLRDGSETAGTLVGLKNVQWEVDSSPYSAAEKAGQTPDHPPPTSAELDYFLIRLDRLIGMEPINVNAPGGPPRGWIPLPAAQPAITPHMAVLILQHPNRQPLKVAFDTDAVTGLNQNQTRVKYSTNTEPGSSGSPCFDLQWNLIALHHYGDSAAGHPPYNQGVPIGAIRELLAARGHASLVNQESP